MNTKMTKIGLYLVLKKDFFKDKDIGVMLDLDGKKTSMTYNQFCKRLLSKNSKKYL